MKTKTHAKLGLLLAATFPLAVQAKCPPGLQAEEMISCISIEGAGDNYQDYLADREAHKTAASDPERSLPTLQSEAAKHPAEDKEKRPEDKKSVSRLPETK